MRLFSSGRMLRPRRAFALVMVGVLAAEILALPVVAGAGVLGGVVSDSMGRPIAGAEVAAYTTVFDGQSEYRCVEATTTDADGRYALTALAPGDYRIATSSSSGAVELDWLGGVSYDSASDHEVGDGRTDLDITRTLVSTVSGEVRDAVGAPIPDATVSLLPAGDPQNELGLGVLVSTDASGTYAFDGVTPEDEYVLQVAATGFQPRFYTVGGAEPTVIFPEAGSALEQIDVTLSQSGLLYGRVVHGEIPVQDARVDLWRLNGEVYEPFGSHGFTDVDGAYEVLDVPEGVYRVAFTAPWEAGLRPVFSGGAASLGSATDVAVTGPADSVRVDAEFAGDSSPGALMGQLLDGSGVAIVGATVDVYVLWRGETVLAATATTDAMGGYAAALLPPGDYCLQVTPTALTPQWITDGDTPLASVFTVAPGQTAVVPDYAYRVGGAIAGVVSAPDGLPDHAGELSALLYEVRQDMGETTFSEAAEVVCEPGGGYAVAGVPAGTYVLAFESTDPRCATRFWPSVSSAASATPLTVADGSVLAGYDGAVGVLGSLGGVVSDAAAGPLEGISVMAHGMRGVVTTTTVTDGSYKLPPLESGEYLLEFVDPTGRHRSRFYTNPSSTEETATPIVVHDGVDASGLDVQMTMAATVVGRVQDEGGDPVDECEVSLYRSAEATPGFVETLRPSPSGEFYFYGLDAGEYTVEFSVPETSALLPQYYGGSSVAPGSAVALADGQQLQLETTTLLSGAGIEGTVSDSVGAPIAGARVVASGDRVLSRQTLSALDGSYRLQGLPSGQYDVVASAPSDAAVAHTGGFDLATQSTQVTAGDLYETLDYVFPVAATISGRVITEDASAVVGADVVLYADYVPEGAGEVADFLAEGVVARTDEDGRFDFGGLAPGRYRCQVVPAEQSGLSSRFWGGLALDDAETHTVVAGENRDLGEVIVSRGSVVEGVLLDSYGEPMPPSLVDVVAYASDGSSWRPVSVAMVDDVGNYRFASLPPGVYKFKMEALGYEECWFESGGSGNGASEVSVGTDQLSLGVTIMRLLPQTVYVAEIVPVGQGPSVVVGSTAQLVWEVAPLDATDVRVEWSSQNANVARVTSAGLVTGVSQGSVRLVGTAVDGSGCAVELTATVLPGGLTIEPIAGTSRYATAIEASKKAFPDGAPCVVIATGSNWPDALGGGALAAAKGGPILLTQASVLPADVLAEIERLGATDAVVLGGEAAVGKPVFDALKAELGAGSVTRIGGAGRYQTAEMIAEASVAELGAAYDGTVFIATGSNFPDALGASPLAAAKGWPLLLSGPGGLGASTLSTLNDIGATKALVLGGTAVVPDSVMGQLAGRSPERLQGAGRYGTARVVAEYGIAHAGLGWDKVAIATGENFPDALAGGVLQGLDGSVMLLTPGAYLHAEPQGALSANKADINTVRFLGGDSAVKPAARAQVQGVLE